MPNSLRCKVKKWHYQGLINDTDRDRLINGLDMVDNIEKIKAEISKYNDYVLSDKVLQIIDAYTKGDKK